MTYAMLNASASEHQPHRPITHMIDIIIRDILTTVVFI